MARTGNVPINLRTKQSRHFTASNQRCGVKCTSCGWTSYRLARFFFDLGGQRPDYITQNQAVKGVYSRPGCPHCGGLVQFTHLALSY